MKCLSINLGNQSSVGGFCILVICINTKYPNALNVQTPHLLKYGALDKTFKVDLFVNKISQKTNKSLFTLSRQDFTTTIVASWAYMVT